MLLRNCRSRSFSSFSGLIDLVLGCLTSAPKFTPRFTP
jgi:hypothetical protein